MPTMVGRRIKLSLRWKLVLTADLVLNLVFLYVFAYPFPKMEAKTFQEREPGTRQEVEVASTVLESAYRLEASGQATREEAQALTLDQMNGLG